MLANMEDLGSGSMRKRCLALAKDDGKGLAKLAELVLKAFDHVALLGDYLHKNTPLLAIDINQILPTRKILDVLMRKQNSEETSFVASLKNAPKETGNNRSY